MALEDRKAELLRGYRIYPHPEDKTVAILRLHTENEHWFCIVTREILRTLVDELGQQFDDLEPLQ